MNFKNIKTKLLFWYSLTIFLILISFSSAMIYIFYEQNIKTVDAKLVAVINDIDHDIVKKYKKHFSEKFDEDEEFSIKNLYITIYKIDETSNILYTNFENKKINLILNSFKKGEYKFSNIDINSKGTIRVVQYHTEKLKENIYLSVSTTLNDKIKQPINNLKSALFILLPIIFLLSILIGYIIISSSLKPVKKVIDEVKQIDANDLNKRLNSNRSNDEIEELIITFNQMLSKIDTSVKKIKRFSNDVSHELKTPLTVIRGELELGLRKNRTNEEYRQILENSLEETKQLQDLIDSLLFLSTANKNEIQNKFIKIDIDELIYDLIIELKKLSQDKNIIFKIKEIIPITLNGNPILLKILIGNIMKNAIKYSNKNSKIEISLNEQQLSIKDYGIGIKEKDLEFIFDRFYRVDEARGRGGYGLGLSIVKNIAQFHNFTIEVNSTYGVGTEFIISFNS